MREIKFFGSFLYSAIIIYVFFFAGRRKKLPRRDLNLIPLRNTYYEFIKMNPNSRCEVYNFYQNLFGNIFLFIPLPIIIIFLSGLSQNKAIILFVFLLSVGVETIQFCCKIGVADIDDVLLNTIGAIIGLVIYRLFESHPANSVGATTS